MNIPAQSARHACRGSACEQQFTNSRRGRAGAVIVFCVLSSAMAVGQLLPAPPNDLCENAQLIEIGQTLSGTTRGATWDDAPFAAFGYQIAIYGTGVWYKLTGDGTPFDVSVVSDSESLNVYTYCGGCDYLGYPWTQCGIVGKEYLFLVVDEGDVDSDFAVTLHARVSDHCLDENSECVEPANDYCEDAQHVKPGEAFEIDTEHAAKDRPPLCPIDPDRAVMSEEYGLFPGLWYRVTGDGSKYTLGFTQADDALRYAVLYCDGCDGAKCLGYTDYGHSPALISWCSQAGRDYLVYVEAWGSFAGVISSSEPCDEPLRCGPAVPPPSNDWCPYASQILGEGDFEFNLSSALPTFHRADPDVFFCWTAPTDGQYTIGACGVTLAPAEFEIRSGCNCPYGDGWIGDSCCSDYQCGQQANVPFEATAGQDYLIRIYSPLPLLGGPGKFRITKGVPPLPSCNFAFLSSHEGGERCTTPGRWEALESTRGQVEIADDFTLAEAFVGTTTGQTYSSACWYGTYFDGEAECSRSIADDFEVTYYADDCGIPAEIVAGPFAQANGTLTVSGPALTGATIMDTLREYHYSAQHARVDLPAERTYWIKITNSADGDCRWYWEAAIGRHFTEGEDDLWFWTGRSSYQDGRLGTLNGFDPADWRPTGLAFCLAPQLRFEPLDECYILPLSERCERVIHYDNGYYCPFEFPPYPVPLHDTCAAAEPLWHGAFLDTIGATTDGPPVQDYARTGSESVCDFALGDEQIHSDVWYTFKPECSGEVGIGLCDSDFDSKLAVYEDQRCPPQAGPIACSDDDCGQELGLDAVVSFHAEQGRDYRLRVGGYQGGSGIGTLSIVHASPVAADLRHFAFLAECFTGPCAKEPCPHAPWLLDGPPCCTGLDFDADGDIDSADHQALVNVLSGP